MKYPKGYEWLGEVGTLPLLVQNALPLIGVVETAGVKNNQTILDWAKETGLDGQGYTADSIAWCGLFMAVVAKRSGYEAPKFPLWALNWKAFGKEHHQPVLGDVLVFVRDGGGHVGIYIGEDSSAYHVLGGNTSDQVMIGRIAKVRMVAARSPAFKKAAPTSAIPRVLKAGGPLSVNEK